MRPTNLYAADLARVEARLKPGSRLGADRSDALTRQLALLYGLAAQDCTDGDRKTFDIVFTRLVDEATTDARVFLADRLAEETKPLKLSTLKLARDTHIDVARPLLSKSTVLSDVDLVEIARQRGVEHMRAIAERPVLSVRVTDHLVLRGDDHVRRKVVENRGAQMSDKSFTRLSLQSREDPEVEALLTERPDLPALVAKFLVEYGSDEAKAKLLPRLEAEAARLGQPSPQSAQAASETWLKPYDFDAAAEAVPALMAATDDPEDLLDKLASADKFPEMVLTFSAVSGLPVDIVKFALVSLDTAWFATAARALSMKPKTVLKMLDAGPWRYRLDARARQATMRAFQAADPSEAAAVLGKQLDDAMAAVA